jgi:hypothetical protein
MHSPFPSALALAGLLALAATGCATSQPPTVQMTVAKASVEGANAAGALAFAPTESRLANDKLASAQKAMAEKDYPLALRLAEEAQADAQLAVSKTQTAKARKAADDAQAAANVQRDDLARMAPGAPK